MPTLPGLLLGWVEASWSLSVEFLPIMYLGFLIYAFSEDQMSPLTATAVKSQRTYTLYYGPYVVAGILAGAVPLATIGGLAGLVIGAGAVIAALIYGYVKKGVPETPDIDLGAWQDMAKLPWMLVPILAAVSLGTGSLLMKSLVALVFFSTVFWEI